MSSVKPYRSFEDRWTPGRVARGVILIGFAIFCVIPIIWLVLAPTKTNAALSKEFPLSFGSFGNVIQAWNNIVSFDNGIVYRWIGNTLLYVAISLVVMVITTMLAGFVLATTDVPGRNIVLIATLFAMIIPGAALVLPLFIELNAAHLIDTIWAVILPSCLFPFGTYLAFIHFSTALPKSIVEAARIDGANDLQIFWSVALPLARPLIGLLTFFGFVGSWNNYFLPFVMLSSSDLFNLPVGLGALIASTPAINPVRGATNVPIFHPEAALMGIVTIIPIAIAYAVSQRHLVKGILNGATKE